MKISERLAGPALSAVGAAEHLGRHRHQRGAPHRILPGPFALLRRHSRLALLFRALGGAVLPVHAYPWPLSALRRILPALPPERVARTRAVQGGSVTVRYALWGMRIIRQTKIDNK